MDSNPDPVILPGDPVILISRLEPGQPRARPRVSQGQAKGQPRARPRASQGQAKGQPGPGQGPAKGQAKGREAPRGTTRGQPGPGQAPAMHRGPCPAMNGHPGRDTDLILRPSESTIDFLSVYIGFRSQNKLQIVILNENIGSI